MKRINARYLALPLILIVFVTLGAACGLLPCVDVSLPFAATRPFH